MQKKWIYGVIIAVILVIGAGGACIYSARQYHLRINQAQQAQVQAQNPVYTDLLLLNTTTDLKLTPQEAKAILPLIEKLKDADSKTAADLTKQIYAQLTGPQYLALQSRGGNQGMNSRRQMPMNGRQGIDRPGSEYNNGQMMRQAALPDIVIKQLQDLAAQAQ